MRRLHTLLLLLCGVLALAAGPTYPNPSDVRSGVTYGPTGADFTGSATVTTPPANTTSPPVISPTAGIACGPDATVTPTYSAGQCPVAVMLDISKMSDTRADRRLWHLPGTSAITDPITGTTLSQDVLTGNQVAAVYDAPGNYIASCDVTHPDSSVTTYNVTVTVLPDTRPTYYFSSSGNDTSVGTDAAHAMKSAAKLASLVNKGNCHIYVINAMTLLPALPATWIPKSGTVIEGIGTPKPILTLGAAPAIYVSNGVSDVFVRNLAFDSPGKASGKQMLAPQGASSSMRAEAMQSSGKNSAIIGCELKCLVQGVQQFNGDFIVLGCTNANPWTISGQNSFVDGPGRYVMTCNKFAGCYGQAVCRTDGTSGGQSGTIERNDISQDPTVIIAGIDLRSADGGVTVVNNHLTNCQMSMSSSLNTPNTVTRNILVSGNQYRLSSPMPKLTSWMNVKDRATAVTITDEDFGPGMAANVVVSSTQADIVQK